jgi:hypothetical protein
VIDGDDLALFARSLGHATAESSGAALDIALVDLGWHEALTADRRTAVSLLFELQGRAGTTSAALDAVLAGALGADPHRVAVLLPPLGRTEPPGTADGVVRGVATQAIRRAEEVLVAAGDGVVRAVAATDLDVRAVGGLDPELGLVSVAGDVTAARPAGTTAAWPDAVAAGQLALAHELVGTGRAMLDLARRHALERIQFGRPIARFQAVRHRLADVLVAVDTAADVAGAAWDDGSPLTASVAKAVAGRAARLSARHCQQVLAGIGFTTEHPLHTFVRRAMVLDRLLGDSRSLTAAMGADLLRDRRLPPMLPL